MQIEQISKLTCSERIARLKEEMLEEPRFASIEQARIVTESYQETEGEPRCIQRAKALKAALLRIEIRIEPEERIVGNRTSGVRGGVVFPETGASWVDREFETLPTRSQDKFQVRKEDIEAFRRDIMPYWKGRSLEDQVRAAVGPHCKGSQGQPEGSLSGTYLSQYKEMAEAWSCRYPRGSKRTS